MAEGEDSTVSRHEFSIAYTGKTREGEHSIDVQVLAPALLAFGKLLREANAEFNSKKSIAKVLVVSDFEHKCFNINFELVVSLYEQLKTLLGTETATSAKNILEWVGIVGGPAATGTLTYLKYLKWRRGRKVTSAKPLLDADKSGVVEVHVEGENNSVHVHNHVYRLSENAKALRATRDAFLPLGHDGFESVQIREKDVVFDEINTNEVGDIVASCNIGIEESKETEPEIEEMPAWLSVYSPVYDQSAPNWRFRLGKEVIYADISATSIARDALDRGGAMVDDAYQVRLQVTTEVDAQGNKKQPEYKVLQVIRFVPASPPPQQTTFLDKT